MLLEIMSLLIEHGRSGALLLISPMKELMCVKMIYAPNVIKGQPFVTRKVVYEAEGSLAVGKTLCHYVI